MSEEMLEKRKSNVKPINIIKVENLIKKISSNKTGFKINGREIQRPNETIANKI